ncbi:MAG TPA: sigma-70 family RNA polymerase sigma factor [Gemmataceae bacterium]|nr:sigma-70 family RNA polymerase sigma factor [Gemmataceae bacterium]
MTTPGPDTEELIERVASGDGAARQQLLARHRARLRQMVAVRLDPRVAARVDPSDVVQEALTVAARQLSAYVRERPLPFYPWLRGLAWEQLVQAHRRHLHAQRRSVRREGPAVLSLPDESAAELAQRLVSSASRPSRQMLRAELRERVQAALAALGERDRELLVLRYLEQLSTRDVAAVLGITEGAMKVRHLRALERLRKLLGDDLRENES